MEGEVQPLILPSCCSKTHQLTRSDDDIDIEQLKSKKQSAAAAVFQVCSGIKCCGLSEKSLADSTAKAHVTRRLLLAVAFCLVFMVVEIIGGLMANSLAILADAAHLMSDFVSFGVALFAVSASAWKPTLRWSYGFHRLEVLGALFSVLLIWLVTGFLMYHAVYRLVHEVKPIDGELMFFIAVVGFLANLVMIFILGHHHHHHGHPRHAHDEDECKQDGDHKHEVVNLNLKGAYLHILGDLIQSIGVLVGGAVIWVNPRLRFVDVVCTLVFSAVVVFTTLKMVRDVVEVLMEGSPRGIDVGVVENGLREISGVVGVHELHIWSVTVGKVLLSCHLVVKCDANSELILEQAASLCELHHNIRHVTVQVEREPSAAPV